MNYCQFRNLTIKRMANAGGVTPILPAEYQQVEWLENGGSGRCYVTPGQAVYDTYHYSIEFEFIGAIGGSIIGRDAEVTSTNYPVATVNFKNNVDARILFKQHTAGLPVIASNTRYIIEYYYDNGYKAYLNNQSLSVWNDKNNDNDKLCLFFSSWGGYAKPCKIYDVTIRDTYNGAALYKYVPCYRKSDNKPGFYDVVTNNFYAGQGSVDNPGTFFVGQDV